MNIFHDLVCFGVGYVIIVGLTYVVETGLRNSHPRRREYRRYATRQ